MVNRAVTLSPVTLAEFRAWTGAQIRMARAALNWTVRDLARATGLHRNTITNIEVGLSARNQDSIVLIESVFRNAGVEFLPQNGVRFDEPPDTSHEGR
jgi:transcriptional regulator with XRE-family HTH domain